MKILTYREPQNPEYQEFVQNLKADAKDMFNYTIEDSLVSVCVCVQTGHFTRYTLPAGGWSLFLYTAAADVSAARRVSDV